MRLNLKERAKAFSVHLSASVVVGLSALAADSRGVKHFCHPAAGGRGGRANIDVSGV